MLSLDSKKIHYTRSESALQNLTGSDIWRSALDEVAPLQDDSGAILCFTDNECSAAPLIGALQLCSDPSETTYRNYGSSGVLDFAHLPLKDPSQKHQASEYHFGCEAQVWIMRDPLRINMMDKMISQQFKQINCLEKTVAVICCDISKPWNAINVVKDWLDVIGRWAARLLSDQQETSSSSVHGDINEGEESAVSEVRGQEKQGPSFAQQMNLMRKKNAIYVSRMARGEEPLQNRPERPPNSTATTPAPIEEEEVEDEKDEKCDFVNFGLPLIFVACNCQNVEFGVYSQDSSYLDEVNAVAAHLLKLGKEYGAAVIFSSSGSENENSQNTEILYSYLGHRVCSYRYKMPFRLSPLDCIAVPPGKMTDAVLQDMIQKTPLKSFTVPLETFLTNREFDTSTFNQRKEDVINAPRLESFLADLVAANPAYLDVGPAEVPHARDVPLTSSPEKVEEMKKVPTQRVSAGVLSTKTSLPRQETRPAEPPKETRQVTSPPKKEKKEEKEPAAEKETTRKGTIKKQPDMKTENQLTNFLGTLMKEKAKKEGS